MLKFMALSLFYLIVGTVILTIFFGIDFPRGPDIAGSSGVLGITTEYMLHAYKHERG
jgi:hypothetical protein